MKALNTAIEKLEDLKNERDIIEERINKLENLINKLNKCSKTIDLKSEFVYKIHISASDRHISEDLNCSKSITFPEYRVIKWFLENDEIYWTYEVAKHTYFEITNQNIELQCDMIQFLDEQDKEILYSNEDEDDENDEWIDEEIKCLISQFKKDIVNKNKEYFEILALLDN